MESISTLGAYAFPLQIKVWIAFVLTMISVAVISATLSTCPGAKHFWAQFIEFFWIFLGSVLEQVEKSTVPARCSRSVEENIKGDSLRLIASLWLLSVVVISASYKNVFKSDYIFERQWSTNWSKLSYLENFTRLGYPLPSFNMCREAVEEHNCKKRNKNDQYNQVWSTAAFCEKIPRQSELRRRLVPADMWPCLHHLKYSRIIQTAPFGCSQAVVRNCTDRSLLAVRNILIRIELVCRENLKEFIAKTLALPKTALIVPKSRFHRYWRKVLQVLDGNGERKTAIAHNVHAKDESFRQLRRTFARSRVMWIGRTIVHKRLRAYSQSGLDGYWKHMETMAIRLRIQSSFIPRKEFAPLGFMNSDVYFIFWAWMCLNAVSVAVFVWVTAQFFCESALQ